MLDLTKPMQTRDGRPARLIYDKLKHEYGPLVFAITFGGEVERLGYRAADGCYSFLGGSDWDIINVPEPVADVIVTVSKGCADVVKMVSGAIVEIRDYDIFEDAEDPDNGILQDDEGRLYQSSWYRTVA